MLLLSIRRIKFYSFLSLIVEILWEFLRALLNSIFNDADLLKSKQALKTNVSWKRSETYCIKKTIESTGIKWVYKE